LPLKPMSQTPLQNKAQKFLCQYSLCGTEGISTPFQRFFILFFWWKAFKRRNQ
jgi:hypothetical protein